MVDLFGADKGNISLPPKLQSPEVLNGEIDDLKQVMILNMQKAFYQVRISDILKRIQRLKSTNAELEDVCVTEKLLRLKMDVEMADDIAQLNRQIAVELDKITDYRKRIKTVQNWMAEEKQAHLDKVEAANEKYEKTRMEITMEIKALNAKINTLEEYKASKTDLRNKLMVGNDLIAKRDAEVKQRCEQIDRKFKIGREKLKKEMYARLQGLAGTFQIEVAASVAKPIHRMMRENVFIKNELADIVRESVPQKERIKRNKELDEQNVYDTAISKRHTIENLIASKIQKHILTAVEEQHTRVKNYMVDIRESESEINVAEVAFRSTKIRADKALQNVSKLETALHRQQIQLGFFKYLRDKSMIEVQRCTNIFYDVKYTVACALKMTDTGKDILEMEDKELTSYLLDILDKGEKQKWKIRTPSLATVLSPEEVYKIGDLGFEATHIDLSRSRITIQKKLSRLSTLKILSSLGVRLSDINSAGSQFEPWNLDILDLIEESEILTDEKSDVSNKGSSTSRIIESQEEEEQEEKEEQKLVQSEAFEGEESGAEKEEGISESEVEVKTYAETKGKVTESEQVKQSVPVDDEKIIAKNKMHGSTVHFEITKDEDEQL